MKSVPKYSQVISKTIHKCHLTNLGEVLFMNLQFIYIYVYTYIYINYRPLLLLFTQCFCTKKSL